jgi:hypothetical protein
MRDPPAAELLPALRHLELIEHEIARHRQNAFRVRALALALVGGFVALHSAQSQPRYMFLAPALALGAWLLDAHADFHHRTLRWLAAAVRGDVAPHPPPLCLDASPFEARVSWRATLLRPARVAFFLPLTLLGAYIAIDAPRLDPEGVPSELFWYLLVTFLGFLALVATAWSWWVDRFGSAVAPSPAADRAAPGDKVRDAAGPFPPRPRKDDTHPFGTAVG